MKKIIRLALISSALFSLPALGSSAVPPQIEGICLSHHVTPWQMVNDVFVKQPTQKTRLNWKRKAVLGVGTAAIGIIGGLVGHYGQSAIAQADYSGSDLRKRLIWGAASFPN